MKCQKCGYENIKRAQICAMCGTPLKKKTKDQTFIIIFVILCIAVGGMFIAKTYSNSVNNRVRIVDRTELDRYGQYLNANRETSDFAIITFGSTTQASECSLVCYVEQEKRLIFVDTDFSTSTNYCDYCVSSDDYKLSYIKGTKIGILRDTDLDNNYRYITVFDLNPDNFDCIVSIGYDPETFLGSTIDFHYNGKDIPFSNKEELSSILSNIEYLELIDGEVTTAKKYADQEKEVIFTPVSKDTINDLYKGNYENYIN